MRIVILGAGFAGLGVVRELVRKGVHKEHEIVVVDQTAVFTYTPWLYRCATGQTCEVAIPIQQFSCFAHVRLVRETVCDYDVPSRRIIFASGGMIAYDVLVIALGAQARTPAIAGLDQYAYTLKRPEDAMRIHERLLAIRHEAERSSRARQIVFVGAGASGVELCASAAQEFADEKNVHITLVDGARLPVAWASASVQRLVTERLRALGVRLIMNVHLEEVGEGFVRCGGAKMACDMLVFLGGVVATPVVRSFAFPVSSSGRILVDDTFRVFMQSPANVFALGDCAARAGAGATNPDPQSAQVAWAQSRCVATNVTRLVRGKSLREWPKKRSWHTLLTVGEGYAVGSVFGCTLWGRPADMLRSIVDQKFFWRMK